MVVASGDWPQTWPGQSLGLAPMSDSCRLLVALSVAAMIHAVALSQGFGFASVVTGDIHSRLRPLIVAQP